MKYRTSSPISHARGFTLVETLVAIAVLLVVIIGPLTAAQKGIQQAYYANEQLSAVFIAQEAIEAVRQRRDNLALSAWNDSSGNTDTSNWSTATSCTGATGPFACEVTKDGIVYERTIRIVGDGDSRSVTVTVTWDNNSLFGGDERSVTLQTYLYDHYRRYGQ